jgi:hypothetical protein
MIRTLTRLAVPGLALAIAAALPAHADTKIEKNLKLDPGGKLTVVSDAGSIEVRGTSASGAHVVLTSQDDDLAAKFDMSFQESPGEVKIVVKKKKDLASMFGSVKTTGMKFEITVPEKTETHLSTGGGHLLLSNLNGDAKAETSGGHIEVDRLTGNAHVETSGGHITAKGVEGALWAETSGGHIEASDIAKDIHVETSGGHIKVVGAKGRVDADTSGGHVDVSFAKGNARGGRIETSGGSITVSLDPAVNLNLEASTSGGSVSTDIPVKVAGKLSKTAIRGSIGSGGETLTVSTSGGSIVIQSIGNAL